MRASRTKSNKKWCAGPGTHEHGGSADRGLQCQDEVDYLIVSQSLNQKLMRDR